MINQTQSQTNKTTTAITGNSGSIVSAKYAKGETSIEKNILEMVTVEIQKQLNRFLIYLITTILVGVVFTIWTMNSRVSQLEGKFSSPDQTIETIGNRLQLIEKSNQDLLEKNHKLEMDRLKIEILKNKNYEYSNR